jgi:hypothetical protein
MKTPGSVSKTTKKRNGQKGQSTTEYVLLLLFVVIAVNSVGKGLKERLGKIMDAAFNKTDAAIQQAD